VNISQFYVIDFMNTFKWYAIIVCF